ncbi:MAG: hypothetical protein RMK91_06630 [Pseudanabaenaceae cyanobacterium SKYGB_i_bin29]|nr:hypothetical protein [Pseudanabaenaceae cyanobacterium SKYG29]MDW8421527.1 hypothetical protein [Pseudanabaenaceae cyanobacterium SKYGB_i_bin29]
MTVDPDLLWLGEMMGADQVLTDRQMIAMLCPHLAGKTLAELTPEEVAELLKAAESFPLSTLPEEEED